MNATNLEHRNRAQAMERLLPPQNVVPTGQPYLHVKSELAFPAWLGSLRLQDTRDHESVSHGTGVGLAYAAANAKATLYVYDAGRSDITDGSTGETFVEDLRSAFLGVEAAAKE